MDPEQEVAALDQQYAQRIGEETEPARQQALALEREQAKNAVWARYAEQQRAAAWKIDALKEYPEAFPGAVQGSTRDEMMNSAKAAHEFAVAQIQRDSASRQAALEEAAKQRLYGRSGGGGFDQQGDPLRPASTRQFDSDIEQIQATLRAGTGEMPRVMVERAIQNVGDMLIQREITGRLPDDKSDRFKEPS